MEVTESSAQFVTLVASALQAAEKLHFWGSVTGHDFSRADKANETNRALAPAEVSRAKSLEFKPFSVASLGLIMAALLVPGCGTPGAPQPPSLNLPDRVEDLAAVRSGSAVSLTWTMPKKNTDKLLLKDDVEAAVCRKSATGSCDTVGGVRLKPGAKGAFSEMLSSGLASGSPRALSYFVELKNRYGRSAGLSNAAVVLAGEAPPPVENLTAEVRKDGVVLHWSPDATQEQINAVRLHRRLLTPASAKPKEGLLAPHPEAIEQNLLVDSANAENTPAVRAPDRALDKDIRFGQTYEYRAQRVARVPFDGQTLELAGELSAPVRVEASDIFPPAVPTGLAAVAILGAPGTEAAIDLSWQPAPDADLAGYAVYRREGDTAWQRVSPAQPLVAPAFHDTQVQPGRTYAYAVSATDQGGNESARSAEAQETVPSQ